MSVIRRALARVSRAAETARHSLPRHYSITSGMRSSIRHQSPSSIRPRVRQAGPVNPWANKQNRPEAVIRCTSSSFLPCRQSRSRTSLSTTITLFPPDCAHQTSSYRPTAIEDTRVFTCTLQGVTSARSHPTMLSLRAALHTTHTSCDEHRTIVDTDFMIASTQGINVSLGNNMTTSAA